MDRETLLTSTFCSKARLPQHLVGTRNFSVATPLAFLGYLSLFLAFYSTKLFMALASDEFLHSAISRLIMFTLQEPVRWRRINNSFAG